MPILKLQNYNSMLINYKKTLIFPFVGTLFLFACSSESEQIVEEEKHHGIDIHYMDTTVNPRDDFYNYVNGTWMKEVEIPSDQKSWGSFYILRKDTDKMVLELLNNAIQKNQFEEGSDQSKAVILFQSILDTNKRNEIGVTPLQPIMEKINEVTDLAGLKEVISKHPAKIANPFFGIYASPKAENSAINNVKLYPGGLGLPDRDYYTNEDEKSQETREQYKAHIVRMFTLYGDDEEAAQDKAERVLALETKLAVPRLTKEKRRDARIQNNPLSLAEINELTPAVNWEAWIKALPVQKDFDTMVVTQLEYMKSLNTILTQENIEDLKTLVSWQTLNNAASLLTTELEYANWEFYSKTLDGTPEQRPADERALGIVNRVIGEAIGKMFVEKYFPAEAKETAEDMVEDIIETFRERIQNLEWMSDDTKVKALEKLNSFTVKIGYPDVWKDYSEMAISEDNSYYENSVSASLWRYKKNLEKINEPVDREEWFMSPQTVNAYYNPTSNEIVFPAAILQPPFFDYKADAAVNFGGIGAVIGHEISHGFDDSGARFDANGNLKNWWTPEDLERFEERTQQLADFYSAIEVEDGLYLNGQFTLGENTADLGGVLSAYHGLQRYYETHEKPGKIDGLTQEQRFFMSWATVWRNKTRPEALRSQILTDPHAPGYYRAYVPLMHVDEFYEAFNIVEGDKLYIAPEKRVRIW